MMLRDVVGALGMAMVIAPVYALFTALAQPEPLAWWMPGSVMVSALAAALFALLGLAPALDGRNRWARSHAAAEVA